MKGINFEDFIKPQGHALRVAVAGGSDISVLEMVHSTPETHFILVGEKKAVRQAAGPLGQNPEDWENCEVVEPEKIQEEEYGKNLQNSHLSQNKSNEHLGKDRSEYTDRERSEKSRRELSETSACRAAASLCRNGKASVLMKGKVHTASFLRALLRSQSGLLKPGEILSHAALFNPPAGTWPGSSVDSTKDKEQDECFFITDSAVNVSPSLEVKKKILTNTIRAARAIGVEKPFIALLAPVEIAAKHIQSTTDAQHLKNWLAGGALGECVADGPLGLDIAASSAAAHAKGISSPISGRTDIYLTPNLDSGNILYKALSVFARFRVAAVLLGAAVPVVLTSRSDSSETRRASLGLALRIAASPVWG